MSNKYVLDENGAPVRATDLYAWGRWMEAGNRTLARTMTATSEVSTVFLGLDHNFTGGVPVLWETLVFGGPLDGERERYATRDGALAGHGAMVQRVKYAENRP